MAVTALRCTIVSRSQNIWRSTISVSPPPGESWRAIEDGTIALGGKLPVNPSGGLIGLGHPVGATGVRMMLDSWRQVTGNAGDYQVEGAKNFATFNVGGSATTSVSFVVGV